MKSQSKFSYHESDNKLGCCTARITWIMDQELDHSNHKGDTSSALLHNADEDLWVETSNFVLNTIIAESQ